MLNATRRQVFFKCAILSIVANVAIADDQAADNRAPCAQGLALHAADAVFTLHTEITGGDLIYHGIGEQIDGLANPTLYAREGDVVQINLVNGDGALHDIAFQDLDVASKAVARRGLVTTISFRAPAPGEYVYFCTLPGHREAGMEGRLVIREASRGGTIAPTGEATALAPARSHPPAAIAGHVRQQHAGVEWRAPQSHFAAAAP